VSGAIRIMCQGDEVNTELASLACYTLPNAICGCLQTCSALCVSFRKFAQKKVLDKYGCSLRKHIEDGVC
jgi:hypothetical protein